jgi:hypothetical protein
MLDLKPRSVRVKEAVQILTKLKSIGIPQNDVGYLLAKQALDIWISDGEEKSHVIPFPRANRTGYLNLPSLASEVATLVLKLNKPESDDEDERCGN